MIIYMVIILLTCLALAVMMMRRVIVHPVLLKLVGISIVDFSIIGYASKLTIYDLPSTLERTFYSFIEGMNLTLPQLALIMNIGTALIIASGSLLAGAFFKKKGASLFLLIPAAAFFVINHPLLCEKAYIYTIKQFSFSNIDDLLMILNTINIVIIIGCALLPYAALTLRCIKTKLFYKKRKYILSMTITAMMDTLVYSSLFFGFLKNFFIFNLDLLKFPREIEKISFDNTVVAYILIVLFVIIAAIGIFRPFGTSTFLRKERVIDGAVTQTVSMILHGYKNAFVAIEMFADNQYGSYIGDETKRLDKIKDIAAQQEMSIKEIINVITAQNKLAIIRKDISLNALVERAIGQMHGEEVAVTFNAQKDYTINVDEYHFGEVLVGLLNNAAEALSDKEDKSITVATGTDDNDVYIEIIDNGCGMKNTNEVFRPFYSSKNGTSNFGMGLVYAKEIIEAHNGIINIESKLGEGTTVQILLPYKEKKLDLKLNERI